MKWCSIHKLNNFGLSLKRDSVVFAVRKQLWFLAKELCDSENPVWCTVNSPHGNVFESDF